MTDIVKRLQTENTMYGYYDSPAIQLEAAEEIIKLRAEVERLRQEPELLRVDLISLCNASRNALSKAYNRARETSAALAQELAGKALEGAP